MKKALFLVVILVLSLTVTSYAAPAIGVIYSGDINGVSVKATQGLIRPQVVGRILVNKDIADINVGVRALYSFGKVGEVDRYVGAGVGYSSKSYRNQFNDTDDKSSSYNGQILVGVEFPLAYKQLTTPFSLSVEALLQARKQSDGDLEVKNHIGIGIHYPF